MTETTSLGTSTFKGTKNVDFNACGVPMASVQLMFADPITRNPVPVGQVSIRQTYVWIAIEMVPYQINTI